MRLALWRSVFSFAITANAHFPRLVPIAVVDWVDERFHRAAMRETLDLAARDYAEATELVRFDCLAGDGPACEPSSDAELVVDLHGEDFWPSSRQRTGWEA